MSTYGPADTDAQEEQRTQTRLALSSMLVPLFFVIGFGLCIIGTYHKPHPNGIKLGVVGPAAQTASLRAGLQKTAGSAFDVSSVPTLREATDAVRQRQLTAAFVPTVSRKQPVTVIVASAAGRLVAATSETFVRSVAASQGEQLVVNDLRPLPSGDEIGIGIFIFMIACTIAGYIAVTVLQTFAPALEPRRRYPIIAGAAILIPTIVYLIGGLGYGTYTGSVGTILAFIGVAALYTGVIGLITRWFQVLLGPPALFVSLAIFVFLNIPSLGATYTPTLLPSFWRFVNHFWIGAETVNAERSILYFGGAGVGGDILRLLAWTAVIIGLLLLPVSRSLRRQREGSAASGAFIPPTQRLAGEP
jgi:hypothetical protein